LVYEQSIFPLIKEHWTRIILIYMTEYFSLASTIICPLLID
jgi:hypothetical protein